MTKLHFRSLLFVLIFATAGIGIVGCGNRNQFQPPPASKVTVAKPVRADVPIYSLQTGRTAAVDTVEIRARVKGYLKKILFTEGQEVEEGDLLYIIEPDEYIANLEKAKADLLAKEKRLIETKVEYDRQLGLSVSGSTSESKLLEAKAAYEVASAEVLAAKAQKRLAELQLSYTNVVAPISGVISKTQVDPGNLVGDGESTLLTTIVRHDPLYIYFSVSERELLEYRKKQQEEQANLSSHARKEIAIMAATFVGHLGSFSKTGSLAGDLALIHERDIVYLSASLINETDYPHKGWVNFADNKVDPATGTILVRGFFPNPERKLYPGVFAEVQINLGVEKNALLVPEMALSMDQAGDFLLIVNDKNVVERRKVEVGNKIGELIVIPQGLNPEDRVVINGLQRARPEATVDPKMTVLKNPEIDTD